MLSTVIVTGSRDFPTPGEVFYQLEKEAPAVIVQGGCPTGADKFARDYAESKGIQCITVPANWKLHGKKAGPIRNQKMLDDHSHARVLAFRYNESRGTTDCIKKAWQKGMFVKVFDFVGP